MAITDLGWLRERAEVVAADPEFALNARLAVFTCLLEADEHRYLLHVDRGRVSITDANDARSWDFAVHGTTEAWERYINNDANPRYRDVLAAVFQGAMNFSGKMTDDPAQAGDEKKLYANLQPLHIFLSKLKKCQEGM